jgi:hypothetical protein
MALGTITKPTTGATGSRTDWTEGNRRYRIRNVQLSGGANYTTGGETISASAVGLRQVIEHVIPMGLALPSGGATSRSVAYIPQSDGSVKQLVHTTGSAEAASNSDQSTFTVQALFIGR